MTFIACGDQPKSVLTRLIPNSGYYYRRFRRDGTWQTLHAHLRERVRPKASKQSTPSAVIVDFQSVKTTEKGGHEVTTRARKSAAERGTSFLARRDWA
jgi:hypothetical protein